MKSLRKRKEIRILIVLIIQFFLLNSICLAGMADEKYIAKENLADESVSSSEETQLSQAAPAVTGYSGLSTQGYNSSSAEQTVDYGSVADNLSDCDLSTQCSILKAAGATESETATALLSNGHDSSEVKGAMLEAGFDPQKTGIFLDNTIENHPHLSLLHPYLK